MRLVLEAVLPFNSKVMEGASGRRNLVDKVRIWRGKHPGKLAVIHCASAGEFEASLPIIEALKAKNILTAATIYSPSGYRIAAKSPIPDGVFYLPFDSKKEIESFIRALDPDVFIFCKHDIWPNTVWTCADLKIPLILANANLHSKSLRTHPFLKGFNRNVFACFDTIFAVSESHAGRWERILGNRDKIRSIGDSRFDRVVSQAVGTKSELPEQFFQSPVFIAGSIWPAEYFVLDAFCELKKTYPQWKSIWVPHEPDEHCIGKIEAELNRAAISHLRLSGITGYEEQEALIIDKVGVLPPLYGSGDVAYVGGGFGRGVHSVIEPAAFSIPVIFGPNNHVSAEAGELLLRKGGFAINDKEEIYELLNKLMGDDDFRKSSGKIAGDMVNDKTGAAKLIADEIAALID